jgi:2-iminobutanoate/2-iminopropanoate deaminase
VIVPKRRSIHSLRAGAALLLVCSFVGCSREKEPEPEPVLRVKRVFHLNPYEKDFGYSQAVLIDKTLYISGSVAVDATGRLVAAGDLPGQLRAAYANIRRTLEAHGADFDEIVKETIYTTDMDALLKASDVRFEYYNKELLPTTSWVQVQRLIDPGFMVSIEVVVELP